MVTIETIERKRQRPPRRDCLSDATAIPRHDRSVYNKRRTAGRGSYQPTWNSLTSAPLTKGERVNCDSWITSSGPHDLGSTSCRGRRGSLTTAVVFRKARRTLLSVGQCTRDVGTAAALNLEPDDKHRHIFRFVNSARGTSQLGRLLFERRWRPPLFRRSPSHSASGHPSCACNYSLRGDSFLQTSHPEILSTY